MTDLTMPEVLSVWIDKSNGRLVRVHRTFRGRGRTEIDLFYINWGNTLRVTIEEFYRDFTDEEDDT